MSWWLLMQESDDLCRGLWIHQEIWGGQLRGETDHSDQWRTPGIKSQQFFSFNGCLFMPDLQIVLGLLANERKHTDQCVLFFFQCHAAFTFLFFVLFFFLVCKDLPEPDGSHLQGANSPVHPDFDWWHAAGRDRSTLCRQIILTFTLKARFNHNNSSNKW